MILYLQATTNVQDLVIDYIEVKLNSSECGLEKMKAQSFGFRC